MLGVSKNFPMERERNQIFTKTNSQEMFLEIGHFFIFSVPDTYW